MDYTYLNQPTFDGQCGIPGMEASLPNCNIPCSYGDSSPFAQMGQTYRYNGVRSFPAVSNPGLPTGTSCGVVPRPRDHPQHAPVFPTGKLPKPPVFVSVSLSLSLCLCLSLSLCLAYVFISLFSSIRLDIFFLFFTSRQVQNTWPITSNVFCKPSSSFHFYIHLETCSCSDICNLIKFAPSSCPDQGFGGFKPLLSRNEVS